MRVNLSWLMVAAGLLAGIPAAPASNLEAPVLSDSQTETRLLAIPAPRGLMIDRTGEVLAGNRTYVRAKFHAPAPAVNLETAIIQINAKMAMLKSAGMPELRPLSPEEVREHLTKRRRQGIPVSEPMTAAKFKELTARCPELVLAANHLYLRDYPQGVAASHLTGYVSPRDSQRSTGPEGADPLWPLVEGSAGLERALNRELSGQDGLLSLVYRPGASEPEVQMVRSPEPGQTVVLTLNLKMQLLAEEILADSKRPGAFVALDADTGEILALASHPGFDPNLFVPAISTEVYSKMVSAPDQPFFPRAFAANYPPGSVFKPIVALAAVESQAAGDVPSYYRCGPTLTIAGRVFRNWSKDDAGTFDVQSALMRSCNTWFYQAAMDTGGVSILKASRAFGLGQKPPLELEPVSIGHLPAKVSSPHALANFSIGQGELLVSPLQMAVAMGGFANRGYLPKAHLVLQTQTPGKTAQVIKEPATGPGPALGYPLNYVQKVREGMKDVVNSSRGTGSAARLNWPVVHGKTGTAQWSNQGEERTLAWFTGFVDAKEPAIAFAVVTEGGKGENLFGGKEAAPMAGEWLKTVYAEPATYGIRVPEKKAAPAPLESPATPPVPKPAPAPAIRARPIEPKETPPELTPVSPPPPIVRARPIEPQRPSIYPPPIVRARPIEPQQRSSIYPPPEVWRVRPIEPQPAQRPMEVMPLEPGYGAPPPDSSRSVRKAWRKAMKGRY